MNLAHPARLPRHFLEPLNELPHEFVLVLGQAYGGTAETLGRRAGVFATGHVGPLG
jgi:hypothetical protein